MSIFSLRSAQRPAGSTVGGALRYCGLGCGMWRFLEHAPVPVKVIGVEDTFGESGPASFLQSTALISKCFGKVQEFCR